MDMPELLPREVTIQKLQRDSENLRKFARFVIILKDGQLEMIDNGHLMEEGFPYAKLIAVLGSATYQGTSLQESVLMEIAYSRTRPYTPLEKRTRNGRWYLPRRVRLRSLSDQEFQLVYPEILGCMERIVVECRDKWKTKGRWWISGPGAIERGIHFTVNHSDERIHQQMVLEDVRWRKKKYLSGHSRRLLRFFREYKFGSYPPKELRRFDRVQRAAALLTQPGYNAFYRAVLLRLFQIRSKTRVLLEAIMELFEIDCSISEQEETLLQSPLVALPQLRTLHCYRPLKQPVMQAKGCSIFEIFLEKKYREKIDGGCDETEVPF